MDVYNLGTKIYKRIEDLKNTDDFSREAALISEYINALYDSNVITHEDAFKFTRALNSALIKLL